MFPPSWRRLFSRPTRPLATPPAPRAARPRLEGLEDRTLLAADLIGGGNGLSLLGYTPGPAVSQNGRYVVFQSQATDLVAGASDSNGDWDIFLRDRVADTTTLVSHAAGASTGNGKSLNPTISADGRFVAFESHASDLVAGDSNGRADIFLYDHQTGLTRLVSHQADTSAQSANGASINAVISADGSRVAFVSRATNLAAGQSDTNGANDVFLYEVAADAVTLVSRSAGSTATAGNGASDSPALSADGRQVAFRSRADDLVAGASDSNADYDVFQFNHDTEQTALVSHRAGQTLTAGNRSSGAPTISADGAVVAFTSYSTDLSSLLDLNFNLDVFTYDRASGAVQLISRNALGVNSGDNFSDSPVLSGDGRLVAYASAASDLIVGQIDLNGDLDVFLHDRLSGATTLVSHRAGLPLTAGAGFSTSPALSADGRVVAFTSVSTDLLAGGSDSNDTLDVFAYDSTSGAVLLVSGSAADPMRAAAGLSDAPRLTTTGQWVLFQSDAADLADGDGNATSDLFVRLLPNEAPVAEANGPYAASEGGPVVLSTTGSHDLEQDAASLTYTWDLDGDGLFGETGADALRGNETGATPTLLAIGMDGPGSHVITLRVQDDTGASSIDTAVIVVTNAAPTASIGGPYVVAEAGSVHLVGGGSDPGGDALSYEWDLDGDGIFGETGIAGVRGDETLASPLFSAAGLDGPRTWDVALRVRDKDGLASSTLASTILVSNAAPLALPGGPYSVAEGGTCQLAGSGSDPIDGMLAPLSYAWDLDGDGFFGETGAEAQRGNETGATPTFSAAGLNGPGSWSVRLRVTDRDGAISDAAEATVQLINAAPAADAGDSYSVAEGGTLQLLGRGSDPGSDALSYAWDLDGDGLFGETGADALRGAEVGLAPTFSAVGLNGPLSRTISLRVTDNQGLSHTDSALVAITNAAPLANAGGPYVVDEGGSLVLTGAGSDPGGDPLTYAWDLDNDGIFGETGADARHGVEIGAAPTFSAIGLGGPASWEVRLRVSDDQGLYQTVPVTISLNNAAPYALPGGPYAVAEGGSLVLTGAGSDPGGDPLTYAWDLDNDGIFGESGADARRGDETVAAPTFDAAGLDGPSVWPVALRVRDDAGLSSDVITTKVQIDPAAPVVSLAGAISGVPGQRRSFTLGTVDASPLDQAAGFEYVIDWGDGTPLQAVSQRGLAAALPEQLTHTFAAIGTYQVQVRAIDQDGSIGVSQVHTVNVARVEMQVDPLDASKTALVFGGSAGNDRMVLWRTARPGEVQVWYNLKLIGTYKPTGRLIVHAGAGNDIVAINARLALPSELYGDDGHDRLTAGIGRSLLVGGAGNDVLRGGGRRDLLIGGAGKDWLYGLAGEDILIGGHTSYDAREDDLRSLHGSWQALLPFAVRVAKMRDRTAAVYLIVGETALNDGIVDVYNGGTQFTWRAIGS